MSEDDETVRVGTGYAFDQRAKAFVTAWTHDDPEVRGRAETRLRRWLQVMDGMRSGDLSVGSRTPVAGWPAWVTPEVLRGGFATGSAAAGGPLRADELAVATRVGLAADRRALFGYFLTAEGLAELADLLAHKTYRVDVPEEAVLLAVGWLVCADDPAAAARLVEQVAPFTDRLRFLATTAPASPDVSVTWRQTAAETRAALARRQPNRRVAAMQEALAVWSPFGDELLALWLATAEDGRVGRRMPQAWRVQAAELLDRYRVLAREHTLCSKHRMPKENLAILRTALEDVMSDRDLDPRRLGLLQCAVDAMVRRRGEPGSSRLAAVRRQQAGVLATPMQHLTAQVVVRRLSMLPPEIGVVEVDDALRPVQDDEAQPGVPAGTPIPESVRAVVERATAGTVEELVARRVVPSAEVLARLVPQISATVVAAAYPDEGLRALMAATYQAFRDRRSLLLLNLEKQVQFDELPWVQAVAGHRMSAGHDGGQLARATARRVGELTLHGFPGTLLPNPMVRELDALSRAAGFDLPFVEELAADIFMGAFSPKFLRAARLAAGLLTGSLYERYYGLDYPAVLALPDELAPRRDDEAVGFATLCADRAERVVERSVAANGTVIEQAQILTTHNLATLVAGLGVEPVPGWGDLADRSFATTCRLVEQLTDNPRPLRTIKDAAYAWRHIVFYLSRLSEPDQRAFHARSVDRVARLRADDRARLGPVLAGLHQAIDPAVYVASTGTGDGSVQPFLGWTTHRHWMFDLAATRSH